MSQPIKNITIRFVPDDRAVIALLLEYLQLCKVGKICVMPDYQRNQICYTAFVEVREWFDSETAYNMIQRIRNPLKEARIVYEDDNWWAVEETKEDDLRYNQEEVFQKWRTEFQQPPITKYDDEEKHVTFKRGLAIEESIFIDDLDIRTVKLQGDDKFDNFCKGFGQAHGFDFETEYAEWLKTQDFPELTVEEEERHDAIIKAEFATAVNAQQCEA